MKCRYCDNEAVYPDGLCEHCHQAEVENRGASVLSDDERDNSKDRPLTKTALSMKKKRNRKKVSPMSIFI